MLAKSETANRCVCQSAPLADRVDARVHEVDRRRRERTDVALIAALRKIVQALLVGFVDGVLQRRISGWCQRGWHVRANACAQLACASTGARTWLKTFQPNAARFRAFSSRCRYTRLSCVACGVGAVVVKMFSRQMSTRVNPPPQPTRLVQVVVGFAAASLLHIALLALLRW